MMITLLPVLSLLTHPGAFAKQGWKLGTHNVSESYALHSQVRAELPNQSGVAVTRPVE